MTSLVGILLGLLFGTWSTWSLRRQTRALLGSNPTASVDPLVYGWLLRVGIAVAILVVLIGWSLSAAIAAMFGYWIGRTVFLVHVHDFL